MKKAITAEQIAEWFTLGTQFANIRITDEATKETLKEPKGEISSSKEPAYLGSPPTDDHDGVKTKSSERLANAPPPLLARYEYPSLPITKNRQELISLIENNSVVIIRGATGSGKTTQLPQFILDHYNEKNAPCNIVVTQPRKIGATSIARWIATERRCTLGSLVGYQVGLEKMATEHTRLIYMTTGVLLQKLVGAKTLTMFSHIFIDEVHERTEEMDFLLLVLRMLLRSNSRYVKIILMSATINCKEFAEYFATPVHRQMIPAYVFEVEGRPFAIDEFYLDDLESVLPYRVKQQNAEDPHISVEMYNLAVSLIQSFDEMEAKDQSKTDNDSSLVLPVRGSVLVFLPGLREISYMHEALAQLARKRLQVYPLHSAVTLEEQNGVFLVPVPGYRKIILSTNIAESSVTVPDVKYVIDFCLARHLVCDPETNYQSLRLTWASKTNCNQRMGRAGRVSKGYCYRLITKEFWKNEIPEYMIPEMLLAPLACIMLKVKLLDMGDPRALLSTALSPPNLSDIVRTVLQLKEIGALSAKNDGTGHNEDGELTFLGRVLAHLPVDLHLGKMVVLGHVFGCLDDCLIVAASLSLNCFFAMPSMQMLAGYRSKLTFANGTPSDSIAFLNAFKAWHSSKKIGQLRHPKDEQNWGKENFIQIKRIREVAELYEDLKKRVCQFNMHVAPNPQSQDYTSFHRQKFILQVVIAGAYYPNYFVQGEIDKQMASRDLSGHDPKSTVMVRNLPPYSFLYYKQLQSLFRQCGQVKTISFDGSRAYVEFYRTSQGSGVLPEVALALLAGFQNHPLNLLCFPSERVELCAAGRITSHMRYSRLTLDQATVLPMLDYGNTIYKLASKSVLERLHVLYHSAIGFARVNVDFQSRSVRPVGVLSSNIDPDKLPPNRMFVVNITEVVEVGQFWGFRADEANMEKQRHLTAQINMRELLPVAVSLYPNLLCLAPYSERNEQSLYYRAKILHVRGSSVEVLFVDFGNTALVPCSSLRELPSELMSNPFQAQEFHVAGMRPSAQSIILGDQWCTRARERFISLVKGQWLIVKLYSILHGVMRVEVRINMDTTEDSVADIMVKEGYAVVAKESYDSEQNHEVLVSLYKDLQGGTYVPNATSSSWQNRKDEDKQLIDGLLANFSRGSESYLKTKARVHGPHSPNRATFHSLSLITHCKSVHVVKESVNSVTLNPNPQDTHQRMLVAGKVAVSSSGAHILLEGTTLMPDIPGLPALLCMIFTPMMELRTNTERTCYTGALCGLGWNSHTQEPVLPEHDIELPFDVKFDVEDVTEINALRVAINRLVCEGPNGSLHLGPEQISHLQDDCRERLVRLCAKSPTREDVHPVYYDKPGKWNQVDPSLRMHIVQPGAEKSKGILFQLHPVILLDN